MNFALAVAKLDQFYNWDNLESLKTYYIISFFLYILKWFLGRLVLTKRPPFSALS